ncbi:PNK3P-domain-containing protein [Amylocystis lapponica]|nr:PNK3P-domain-containing protein [Amylocystis lapponica]
MPSSKRSADHLDPPGPAPKKLYSIFDKSTSAEQSTFRWLPALGPKRTCMHGVNLDPNSSSKIAAFDLDGCLIEGGFPTKSKGAAPPHWQWWRPGVPAKLKEVHDAGYAVVVITNQALRSPQLAEWKKKIPLIDVPFRLFAATARDGFRKPMPGMWDELERVFAEDNVQIDKDASFFVGDAAGRPSDHAGTDRKWALNIDIPFFTPEHTRCRIQRILSPRELCGAFPTQSVPTDDPDLSVPRVTPSSTPLVPADTRKPEIVVFVGYPSLGKSAFFRAHFAPAHYVHVNQDMLRTRERCVKAARDAVHAGQSVVVDNTNRDAPTRKHYVDLARDLGVPIRCIVFQGSLELAWHNNLYRAYNLPPRSPARELLPYNAFTSFRARYEEPELSEGFREIKKVNWVFEGDADAGGSAGTAVDITVPLRS